MKRRPSLFLLFLLAAFCAFGLSASADAQTPVPEASPPHTAALGDTWSALAWRFGLPRQELLRAAGVMNAQRQPAAGAALPLPAAAESRNGRFLRPLAGGTLALAARQDRNPWSLTLANDLAHPFRPLLYTPVVIPGGRLPPREFPPGLSDVRLAPALITPGSAFALQGAADGGQTTITAAGLPLLVSSRDGRFTALGASGAFLPPGEYLLTVHSDGRPLWEQPLAIRDRDWTWEQVTFKDSAVLDPEAIRVERERLQKIWDTITPAPLWQGAFTPPITEFVEISSHYGARRSVNGGPYSSYHEGTDYSAYAGTAVRAPAAGKVVLAEELAIRGGAVILDHGLGLHSGYYHLSALHVLPGQEVARGDLLGEVGTTGRSTGNHLHWDLLVGRTWVDPLTWLAGDLARWLSPPEPSARERE